MSYAPTPPVNTVVPDPYPTLYPTTLPTESTTHLASTGVDSSAVLGSVALVAALVVIGLIFLLLPRGVRKK